MAIEFHRDGPWESREGWVWARLEDVCKNPERIDPARQLTSRFRYIDLSAIDDGKIVQAQNLSVAQAPSRARQRVRSGDTLLSCVRVYLRNNAIVPDELDGSVASTAFCILRPSEAIDARYLFWFVHSRKFTETLIPLQRGNSPPAVLDDDVRDQLIPVPPLPEQRRIVARIDELFTEIADGETSLARAREDLDTWRRALLKAAVTGELRRGWRETNGANEMGTELLARVRSQRDLEAARRKRRPLKLVPPSDEIKLPVIPGNWAWAQIGDLLFDIEAGLNVKAEGRPPKMGEAGIVKISAVTWDEFDEAESKTLPPHIAINKDDVIKPGDLLISRANTLELVGAPVIVKSCERRLVLSDKVLRLLIVDDLHRWIELCLKSPLGRHQIERYASGNQLSMRNITQENIARVAIPLPPRIEIEQSIRLYEESNECRDDGRASVESADHAATSLRQSILNTAFEGRLVEQDPRDEPAGQLLARLSQPNETPTQARRTRQTRRAAVPAM
jgi:type I restriction enzyme S subunit